MIKRTQSFIYDLYCTGMAVTMSYKGCWFVRRPTHCTCTASLSSCCCMLHADETLLIPRCACCVQEHSLFKTCTLVGCECAQSIRCSLPLRTHSSSFDTFHFGTFDLKLTTLPLSHNIKDQVYAIFELSERLGVAQKCAPPKLLNKKRAAVGAALFVRLDITFFYWRFRPLPRLCFFFGVSWESVV